MNQQHEQTDQEHHVVSPFLYLTILLCLLVATGLTVWASYIDLGEWHIASGVTLFWNPVIALAIACTKMILVVLFFMHIKYSTKLTKLTVISGVFTFLALISMTLADYMSRAWGRW
ncbi:MAG TPA: cytochrome C oxidase subunit IV family protein [Terracidiphilus sp.]|jgi:cytochrome c oxidase subunit IV|nr:cytochrome C oxidase subunit IV family protein [Terracidiphilus sp.]